MGVPDAEDLAGRGREGACHGGQDAVAATRPACGWVRCSAAISEACGRCDDDPGISPRQCPKITATERPTRAQRNLHATEDGLKLD